LITFRLLKEGSRRKLPEIPSSNEFRKKLENDPRLLRRKKKS